MFAMCVCARACVFNDMCLTDRHFTDFKALNCHNTLFIYLILTSQCSKCHIFLYKSQSECVERELALKQSAH